MKFIVFDKIIHKNITDGKIFDTLEKAQEDAKESLKISFVETIKIYKVEFIKNMVKD